MTAIRGVNSVDLFYDTQAAAQAAKIPFIAQEIETRGYRSPRDEGAARYKRTAGTPTFTDANGNGWLLIAQDPSPFHFGLEDGSTADQASVIQDWMDHCASTNRPGYCPPCTLYIKSPLYVRSNMSIKFDAGVQIYVDSSGQSGGSMNLFTAHADFPDGVEHVHIEGGAWDNAPGTNRGDTPAATTSITSTTQANLADIANAVNTSGKSNGSYRIDAVGIYWRSRGSGAGDKWDSVGGTLAPATITPA